MVISPCASCPSSDRARALAAFWADRIDLEATEASWKNGVPPVRPEAPAFASMAPLDSPTASASDSAWVEASREEIETCPLRSFAAASLAFSLLYPESSRRPSFRFDWRILSSWAEYPPAAPSPAPASMSAVDTTITLFLLPHIRGLPRGC